MAEIQGLDQLSARVGRLAGNIRDLRPQLREIASLMASSFQENFRVGGRPTPWTPSLRARRESGQTLLRTGRLMRSLLSPRGVGEREIVFGTNLPYAALHQFGGVIQFPARSELFKRKRITRGKSRGRFKKGTEAGSGFTRGAYTARYPARPFIVFQPEDIDKAERILFGGILA